MMRYGEESQQVSLDRLTHLINVTRGVIEQAGNIKSESEFELYVGTVR